MTQDKSQDCVGGLLERGPLCPSHEDQFWYIFVIYFVILVMCITIRGALGCKPWFSDPRLAQAKNLNRSLGWVEEVIFWDNFEIWIIYLIMLWYFVWICLGRSLLLAVCAETLVLLCADPTGCVYMWTEGFFYEGYELIWIKNCLCRYPGLKCIYCLCYD